MGGAELPPPNPPSTSPRTWSAGTYPGGAPSFLLEGVAASADGSKLVAGGGSQTVYTSSDGGKTYSAVTARSSEFTQQPAWINGQFFLGGLIGQELRVSVDGVNWSTLSTALKNTANNTSYFFYGNKIIVGFCQNGQPMSKEMFSLDGGVTWTNCNADSSLINFFNTTAGFDGSQFFAAGFLSTTAGVATSSDGKNWSTTTFATSLLTPQFMAGIAGLYILCDAANGYIVSSTVAGLATGTKKTMPAGHGSTGWTWAAVAVLPEGRIVAFATAGDVMWSLDRGATWVADTPVWPYNSSGEIGAGWIPAVFAGNNIALTAVNPSKLVGIRGENC